MPANELTWDQTLRFRLLEIVLQWEGRLTTNHLMTAFNIGRQQASRDINHYLTHYSPEGLIYDRSLKGYKPTEQFVPRFSEGKVDEYLMLLHREKQHQRQHEAGLLTLPLMDLRYGHIEILDVPNRHIEPKIVRVWCKRLAVSCGSMSITYPSAQRSRAAAISCPIPWSMTGSAGTFALTARRKGYIWIL